MRVVSLACSNTEIVCALGCEDLLVGVDDHSDRPAEVVADLPRVGPDLDIDIDAVADLEPDVVLASLTVPGHEKVIEALEDAWLDPVVLEPERLSDVFENIREIAHTLGVAERGEALIDDMRAHLNLKQVVSPAPKLLVQWWNRPTIVPGRLSWVTDLITLAGGVNPLRKVNVRSAPLEDEEVAQLNPDAIILSWCGVAPEKYRPEVILDHPAWQDVKAIRKKQVYSIPEAYLGRPGPGLLKGFDALKEVVQRVSALS